MAGAGVASSKSLIDGISFGGIFMIVQPFLYHLQYSELLFI